MTRDHIEELDVMDQFLQLEEFVPENMRQELRRQMEEAPKQRIRINPKDREWFEGEMRKANADSKQPAEKKKPAPGGLKK